MTLIPLDIPPGVRKVGTDLQAAGRWISSNLVRWRDGSLRPVGGWRTKVAAPFSTVPRTAYAWQDNSGGRAFVAGSYDTLTYINESGDVFDITPVGLTSGLIDALINTGYGGGFYGSGFYNESRTGGTSFSEATTWSLDNFGQYLVACSTADGKLYEWQLVGGTPAAVIAGAPTGCVGMVVTEERFLMAFGAGGNPRLVQWCDREDNTTWVSSDTNEAGEFEIQTNGQIMTGVRTKGQTLIITDTDAHVATYVGSLFVYGFERVGTSCGVVSRQAVASVDDGVIWMGRNNFYLFTGTDVRELPCEVADHVFSDINASQISKSWAVANSQHGEVWFFYPSGGGNEIDRYVYFDYRENHWAVGIMSRTCGIDGGVFRYPNWVDGTNLLEHEVGFNYSGAPVYAETGPISLGNGDNLYSVNKLYPDEESQGGVDVTFRTRNYPNGPESDHGPYDLTSITSVRFTGRQVRMRVEGAQLFGWRVGVNRLDAYKRGIR